LLSTRTINDVTNSLSYGLRQYGGWIREEILADLTGREAARTVDPL
jgi:hypothetical protein